MASDKILTVTGDNFGAEVATSDAPVLVDFWAPWCGPCRMIAPIVEELAEEYAGKVLVGKVNVDENTALSAQFGVMSIPTLLIFKNGQPVERIVGYTQKKDLQARLNSLLA